MSLYSQYGFSGATNFEQCPSQFTFSTYITEITTVFIFIIVYASQAVSYLFVDHILLMPSDNMQHRLVYLFNDSALIDQQHADRGRIKNQCQVLLFGYQLF